MKPAIQFLARHGFICGFLVVAGCAHYPVNARLIQSSPNTGYHYRNLTTGTNTDSLLIILAFSGGGHRAAALSYGALEELARTDIVWEGQPKRLLDEVDMISAVSGGSFTAAYYALFGDRIFDDYEKKFLRRNIQRELIWRLLSPLNWPRFASAEFYDRHIFAHKTYGDLANAGRRPFLLLNATDMSSGARFEFTQDQFDWMCSDLSSVPVGRAVAASSAFPVLLTPITINNYAGSCGWSEPPEVQRVIDEGDTLSRRFVKAQEIRAIQDVKNHPYFHLIDGGISDNLGLRAPLELVVATGGIREAFRYAGLSRPRKILIIASNASTHHDMGWDKRARSPGVTEILLSAGSVIDRYSFESRQVLRASIQQWERELNNDPSVEPVKFYRAEVSFDRLADPKERDYFESLRTGFNLPPGAVDRLREVAGRLLRESKSYQELLRDLASEEHPIPNDEREKL
jgi:NTE family protein